MNKSLWLLVAVVILAAGAYFVFNQPRAASGGTIKIGAPLLLSGDFVTYGTRVKNSIDLAVADFKAKHPGINVEVIYEDTHGEVKQSVSAYQKLVGIDKVDLVVGPMLQTEMAALLPLVAKDGVPVISLAPIPQKDRGNYANPLVVWPDPTREAEQMAAYMFAQGERKVGILGTVDTWENEVSDAFAAKFASLGGTVTAKELTLPDTKNDRTAVTKILQSKPDALFFGTYYKFFDFVKNARELGFTGKLYSIEIDSYLADQTKGYSDGLRFISPNFYTEAYTEAYKKLFNESPTIPGGQAYDAASIALKLLFEHTDRASLLNAMKNLDDYKGVSGEITWDATGRAVFPLSIFEIQNGIINKI